jgi:uracil-DNA glycosylase
MAVTGNDWDEIIGGEFKKEYFSELRNFLKREYKEYTVYPEKGDILQSLVHTPYKDTKVVILGQDPYHGKGQAHGLSFSVQPGMRIPPSLLNIYKEIKDEYGYEIPNNGYLISWADQGVLLLNNVLTVREGEPNSHRGKGWEKFTDKIIEELNKREEPVIFVLWGNNAKEKEKLITGKQHFILKSAHPSPLSASRGFFGNKHFKKINEILKNLGKKEIEWKISNI